MRVAGGAIARKYLRERAGIEIYACLVQLGPIGVYMVDPAAIDQNPG